MMQQNVTPSHCGMQTRLNHHNFPNSMKERKVHITIKSTPWHQVKEKRKAFLNDLSAAGGNITLLLEDTPAETVGQDKTRSIHIVALSTKSPQLLKNNTRSLIDWVRSSSDLSL
jgi:naphtho-gamma-pyrone polyketide synthase